MKSLSQLNFISDNFLFWGVLASFVCKITQLPSQSSEKKSPLLSSLLIADENTTAPCNKLWNSNKSP